MVEQTGPPLSGIHSGQINTRKRTVLDNMTSGFKCRGSDPGPAVSTAEVETLHSKIVQLVVAWDFLADALAQWLNGSMAQYRGARGKKWCARIIS